MTTTRLAIVAAALGAAALGLVGADEKGAVVKDKRAIVIKDGAFLGVGLTEETEGSDGGARVTMVVPDSPAAKAGLAKGDVIVGINGEVVRGPAKLTQKIHASKAGDAVTLDVLRDGKRRKVSVDLAASSDRYRIFLGGEGIWNEEARRAFEEAMRELDEKKLGLEVEKEAREEAMREVERSMEALRKTKILAPRARGFYWVGERPRLGVELVETTPELREHLGGTRKTGVLVGRVLPGSAAEKAGIKVGDLIVSVGGTDIEEFGQLVEAIGDHAGETVDIDVLRDRRPVRVEVALPSDEDEEDLPSGPRASVEAWDDDEELLAPAEWPDVPPAPPAPPAAPLPPEPPAPPAPLESVVVFV